MYHLAICLLFATSLAQSYNHQAQIQAPPENLIFNFEHRRLDQPPIVEMRNENLRQYMGRPKPMTTTPAPASLRQASFVPNFQQMEQYVPQINPTTSKYREPVVEGPMATHLPASLPPPPDMLTWMDLSDQSIRQQGYQQPIPYNVNEYNYKQKNDFLSTPHPLASQYVPQNIAPHQQHRENRQPVRGNHRFSWEDITTTSAAPIPMPVMNRRPPPSVPTLSPWKDGFGK